MADRRTHVFVVCPNNSGSTLLTSLLGTSPNATIFDSVNHEGQWVARDAGDGLMPYPVGEERRNWTINVEKFSNPAHYDWPRLYSAWDKNWKSGPRVRVEGSPSLVVSASMFRRRFDDTRFIISMRNPYAFAEGVRRREGHTLETAARHWIRTARFQMRNRRELEPAVYVSYEDLCNDPEDAIGRILDLVPELETLALGATFEVMALRSRIVNQNAEQVARLTAEDVRTITKVLSSDLETVDAFGYNLIR